MREGPHPSQAFEALPPEGLASEVPPRAETEIRNPLSKRRMAILTLLAEGENNQYIAEKLGISVRTVKQHLTQIAGRLGLKRPGIARARVEMVIATARVRGILPPEKIEPLPADYRLVQPLTPIEIQILNLMANRPGITNFKIAEALMINNKNPAQTIKNRLVEIFNKLGCGDRRQATALFKALKLSQKIPDSEPSTKAKTVTGK